jgi:hypothetical protein
VLSENAQNASISFTICPSVTQKLLVNHIFKKEYSALTLKYIDLLRSIKIVPKYMKTDMDVCSSSSNIIVELNYVII